MKKLKEVVGWIIYTVIVNPIPAHRNFDLGVSQADHPEIFEGVPSEGEGLRLVKMSLAYLIKTGHIWLVPKLAGQSGFKYMGYFLGKRYKKLPKKVILFCTMNREYWKNE